MSRYGGPNKGPVLNSSGATCETFTQHTPRGSSDGSTPGVKRRTKREKENKKRNPGERKEAKKGKKPPKHPKKMAVRKRKPSKKRNR